jgi:hypothetical protein
MRPRLITHTIITCRWYSVDQNDKWPAQPRRRYSDGAASYACPLTEKSLLYFHPILSHMLWNGTVVNSGLKCLLNRGLKSPLFIGKNVRWASFLSLWKNLWKHRMTIFVNPFYTTLWDIIHPWSWTHIIIKYLGSRIGDTFKSTHKTQIFIWIQS